MCGIAGIIYRDGTHDVGLDMTRMLQSMKHRGPDSTGYALYRPRDEHMVMRYKLADANTPRDFEFSDRLDRHQGQVLQRLRAMDARVLEVDEETEYAYRVAFQLPNGNLKELADRIEDIPDCEVLSLGHSLEIVKDLCDSEIIAVYPAEKMSEGGSLEDAMKESLEELDGVFTYIAVTAEALGVCKDEMAAKPLVLYESDGVVALASEEIAIRAVLEREIDTHDPYEGEVLVWQR